MAKLKTKKPRYRVDFVDTVLDIKTSWVTDAAMITADFIPKNHLYGPQKDVCYSRIKLELDYPIEVEPKKKRKKKKIKNGKAKKIKNTKTKR